MATFVKFQPFVENLAEAKFNFASDTLKVALTNTAPNATDGQLSQITEIDYTNLSSRTLASVTSSQTGGTYTLDAANLVLTASGAVETFRYVVIYDDTATNDLLIGYYDYGSSVTLANGETFAIQFDATGILTVA